MASVKIDGIDGIGGLDDLNLAAPAETTEYFKVIHFPAGRALAGLTARSSKYNLPSSGFCLSRLEWSGILLQVKETAAALMREGYAEARGFKCAIRLLGRTIQVSNRCSVRSLAKNLGRVERALQQAERILNCRLAIDRQVLRCSGMVPPGEDQELDGFRAAIGFLKKTVTSVLRYLLVRNRVLLTAARLYLEDGVVSFLVAGRALAACGV